MGVPKFFRWLSERYPLINETFVSHNPLRRVDALYLDANGILHNATHGPDVQLHEPDKIVIRVFTYIEKLVRLIKPKDTLFIALDGVAPRAKMNQQRQRRFRTAKEARESKDANPEDSFDSNAITPGTEFMEWITPHLKFFIQKKMSEDELWKGLKVIYSGHEVPGEGEHKIMNYIRYMKSKDDYNAEYSHCVYGLDADLIFLCLAMHDPFMYLLREEVTFEKLKKKMSRKSIFESQNFQLLHISILREYLGFEFIDSRERGQHLDLERIIDDFILICLLLGNDFVPHAPSIEIAEGALDFMMFKYKEVLDERGEYLTRGTDINFEIFSVFIKKISKRELNRYEEKLHSTKRFQRRSHDDFDEFISNFDFRKELERYESSYKEIYYASKWNGTMKTAANRQRLCKEYLSALLWITRYYREGVCSWTWFYPHLYSPFLSDLENLDLENVSSTIIFDLGSPYRPFEQLLSVIPPASVLLVPEPLRHFMLSDDSPIIDFYPAEFEEDLNGKTNSWESIILIPFIDEGRLFNAIKPIYKSLSAEESKRNEFQENIMYTYETAFKTFNLESSIPNYVPGVFKCSTFEKDVVIPHSLPYSADQMRPYVSSKFYGGFSCIRSIKAAYSLKKTGQVSLFGRKSNRESLIVDLCVSEIYKDLIDAALYIELHKSKAMSANAGGDVKLGLAIDHICEFAEKIVRKRVYVNWPHFFEAIVLKVSTDSFDFEYSSSGFQLVLRKAPIQFSKEKCFNYFEMMSKGVSCPQNENFNGMLYLSIQKLKKVEHLPPDLNVVPIYSQELEIVPLNLIVQLDESCFDNISSVRLDAGLIYTGSGHFEGQSIFGCKGMLMETKNDNAVEICFSSSMKISNCLGISIDALNTDNFHSAYLPALEIANLIEISPLLLSKITGTVIAKPGNANIGLELKLRKQELLVPELVRMNFDPTSGAERWEYSVEVVKLLRSYKDMFPEVFDVVSADATALTFDFLSYFRWKEGYSSVGLRMDAGRFLTSVCSWLKEQSIFNHNLVSLRTQVLDAKTIELLDKSLQVTTLMHRFVCSKTEILVPSLSGHEIQLDSELAGYSDVQLGDRVHYAFGDAGVPFGLGGFIIGIHRDEIPEELYYSRENSSIRKNLLVEVMFDEPLISGSSLNGKCKSNRGIRLHLSSLINLSYRMRNSPQQPQILQLVCLKLPSSINPAEYVPRMLDSMPFPYS